MTTAERRASFFDALHRQGYSYQQIGERFGVSGSRASQIAARHRRRIEENLRDAGLNLARFQWASTGWTPKVISKVEGPLNDATPGCKIESGGS